MNHTNYTRPSVKYWITYRYLYGGDKLGVQSDRVNVRSTRIWHRVRQSGTARGSPSSSWRPHQHHLCLLSTHNTPSTPTPHHRLIWYLIVSPCMPSVPWYSSPTSDCPLHLYLCLRVSAPYNIHGITHSQWRFIVFLTDAFLYIFHWQATFALSPLS